MALSRIPSLHHPLHDETFLSTILHPTPLKALSLPQLQDLLPIRGPSVWIRNVLHRGTYWHKPGHLSERLLEAVWAATSVMVILAVKLREDVPEFAPGFVRVWNYLRIVYEKLRDIQTCDGLSATAICSVVYEANMEGWMAAGNATIEIYYKTINSGNGLFN